MYKKTKVMTKEEVRSILDRWAEAPRETVSQLPLAIEVSKKTHGFYQLIPHLSGTIDGPVEEGNWRYVPREVDNSLIPKEADRQVNALKDAGVVILQEIIGHNMVEEVQKEASIKRRREKMERCKEEMKEVGKDALKLLAIGSALCASAYFLFLLNIFTVVDPAVIVVLEGGQWLCVTDWDS